jgi:hypothetical protein
MRAGLARVAGRAVLLVAVTTGVATAGCAESGADAEDERRLGILLADRLLVTVPPGGTVERGPDGETTDSDLAWGSGGGTNSAGSTHALTGPDPDAARFYVDTLDRQGWTQVAASCSFLADRGRWVVTIGARRWYDGFEGRAAVTLEPAGDAIRAVVGLAAPFHAEAGEEPEPRPPDVACLDDLG